MRYYNKIPEKAPKALPSRASDADAGTHRRTRTSDLPLRRRPLYPTELCGRMDLTRLFYPTGGSLSTALRICRHLWPAARIDYKDWKGGAL